jgi:hypothetical protein
MSTGSARYRLAGLAIRTARKILLEVKLTVGWNGVGGQVIQAIHHGHH